MKYLKSLLIILLVAVAATSVRAQSRAFGVPNLLKYDNKLFHFGFLIGYNSSDFLIYSQAGLNEHDTLNIINTIVDNGDFMEVQKDYAKNIICGFARFNGRSTGIIANQPNWLAGVLDCDASRKAARFVRFCDAFNIQILTLVDVPGFLCGTGQEYAGIIDHGAKLMFAYGEATVPKVTITVRKSYGGSHIVMSCKQLRGDMCYAWPNAEIAVMGASGAVGVLQAKAIKAIEDPAEKKAFIAEKEAEYKDKFASPYQAANRGYIDDVIEPRNTRARIIRAFEMLQTKRLTNPLKKHSNIPL